MDYFNYFAISAAAHQTVYSNAIGPVTVFWLQIILKVLV
jgi:hypothetical protein